MIYRILNSILVFLASIILVADDLIITRFNINFENNFGFTSTANLVYSNSQSICVMLLILSFLIKQKPFKIFYLSVVYVEILQFYWVFFSKEHSSYGYFNIYALGLTILFALFTIFLNRVVKNEIDKNAKIDFLQTMLDLQLTLRDKNKSYSNE